MEPGWYAIPNLQGRVPAMDPPKDKLLVTRNLANRIEGSVKRYTTEHLVWWDAELGCFVRLTDDLFRDTVFTFFHEWRLFAEEPQ